MRRRVARKRRYTLKTQDGRLTLAGLGSDLLHGRPAQAITCSAYAGQHFITLVPVQSLEEIIGGFVADAGVYALTGPGAILGHSQAAAVGVYKLVGATATLRKGQQSARRLIVYAGQHFVTLPPVQSVEESGWSLRAYSGLHALTGPATHVTLEKPYRSGAYRLIGQAAPLNGR